MTSNPQIDATPTSQPTLPARLLAETSSRPDIAVAAAFTPVVERVSRPEPHGWRRADARFLSVGSEAPDAHLAHEGECAKNSIFDVVGACVPNTRVAAGLPGTIVPIVSRVNAVDCAIVATGANTSTGELPADKVTRFSWGLETDRQHLALDSCLYDARESCAGSPS